MCGSASVFAKLAMACILLAFILQIVAVSTDYWMTSETTIDLVEKNVGLWKYRTCPLNQGCTRGDIPDWYDSDSFTATQAFECIILILMLVPVVLIIMYVFMERFRDMSIGMFLVIMCVIIVCFGIIAMIVWLTQVPVNHHANFSFGFAVMAFVLIFLAGILLIPDIRSLQEKRRQRKPMKVSPTDHSYNRRYQHSKFNDNVRHYYNPNREPYRTASPPPSYRTLPRGGITEKYNGGGGTRADIMDSDIYLGGGRY